LSQGCEESTRGSAGWIRDPWAVGEGPTGLVGVLRGSVADQTIGDSKTNDASIMLPTRQRSSGSESVSSEH
jgi:hypothetical protein